MINKKSVVFFILFTFIFSIGCYAQSNNPNQRFVGAWVQVDGNYVNYGDDGDSSIWNFNLDGTGTRDRSKLMFETFSNNKIIITISGGNTVVYDFVLSTDGRTLYLFNQVSAIWLKKR